VMRLAALLLAALCVATSARATAAEPYVIDAILGVTGPSAFVGQSQQSILAGLEATVNQHGGINGTPIHFVVQDNQSTAQVALQLANDDIAKKAPVLLVSGLLASCQAIMPLVTSGPVEYCLSPALYPAKGGFVFSSGVSTMDSMAGLVRYLRERDWKAIATITSTDATGQDADKAIAAAFGLPENRSLHVVDAEHFVPSDLSVSAQMEKIKQAKPAAVIVWTSGTPFGTVLRAIKDTGLDVPVITTNGNMTHQQMKQYAALLPSELLFPATGYLVRQAANAEMRAAQQQYFDAANRVGLPPDNPSGFAWDAGTIIVDALRHFGTGATAAQIKAYIDDLHGYSGISGTYNFRNGDRRGLSVNDVLVARWDAVKATWTAVSKLGG
jgi:branched-chain amino acid transport system substrate-binding protein